jgi:TolB-like protein/Tfp pilus assembly protein PilF
MQPERDYESLLESVADGAQIDWAALDASAATSAERTRYRNLRLVARVAELHRTLVLDDELDARAARVDEAALPDPTTWGHLTVTSRLASGAFGRIYRAHDSQLNRDVALKLLRGDVTQSRPVDRILSEARTLAQVRHPNVVTVHGADVRDGRAGLWMELVEGQTLDAWLTAHGPMGAGEAATIGIDLCRALAAVHAAGLVHGDVKAQNVVREQGGRIVLMDFGAGRAQGADAAGVSGTPMYLAPEVLAGEPPTIQSDLYSLAVLLFHLLTRAYPYIAVDVDGLRNAHADGDRRWLRDLRPDLPSELVQTIEQGLEADPARRSGSAGEMERALHRATRARGVEEPVAVPVPSGWQWPTLRFALTAAALVIVIVGLIATGLRIMNPGALAATKSIAVLPLVEVAGTSGSAGMSEGLHDQLITTLGQIKSLRVVSRTSVLQFKGSQLPSSAIAKNLGVDAALESTLWYVDGGLAGTSRVRVNSSLMIAGENVPIWSQTFDRPLGELFALQADIAREVAKGLNVPITALESSRLNHPQQTNPAAEAAYLQGRQELSQYGRQRARRALEAFERAAQLDPQYALAHAATARAYVVLAELGDVSRQEGRASATAAIQKALNIDENLPEARAALGDIKWSYDWDWLGAEAEFKRALEVNPSFTYARKRYAGLLTAARRLDEGLDEAVKAEALDPRSAEAMTEHGMILYYGRDYPGARDILHRALELEPKRGGALAMIGRIDEAEGHFDAALDVFRKMRQIVGSGNIGLDTEIIRVEALSGRRDEAEQHLSELQRSVAANHQHIASKVLANVELAFGNRDRALDLLQEAVNERDPDMLWLAVDARYDDLRPMPRFATLLAQLRIPDVRKK